MLGPVHEGKERGINTCFLHTLCKAAQSAESAWCILNFSFLVQAVAFAKERAERRGFLIVILKSRL